MFNYYVTEHKFIQWTESVGQVKHDSIMDSILYFLANQDFNDFVVFGHSIYTEDTQDTQPAHN